MILALILVANLAPITTLISAPISRHEEYGYGFTGPDQTEVRSVKYGPYSGPYSGLCSTDLADRTPVRYGKYVKYIKYVKNVYTLNTF